MKYLENKRVNTGRQPEIDMAKGVGIISMILIHAFQECAPKSEGILRTTPAVYNGLFGAGVFIVCTGIGMRYSRHQEPKDYAARGIALLTIAQLVNLLRNALPALAAFRLTGERVFIPLMLDVFNSDILSFFGLSFLLMALLKRLKLRDGTILAIGLAMNLLTTLLASVMRSPEAYWPHRIQSLFFLTDDALFPLGIHFVMVAFGYLIGGIYPYIADKDRMANRVLLSCIPISVIYITLRMNVPFPLMPPYILEEEPTVGLDSAVLCLNTLILLGIMYKISRLTGGRVPAFISHLSKHINSYYCVSEVLIGVTMVTLLAARGELMRGQWMPFLFGLLVIAVCYFCIEFNERHLHFTIAGLQGSRRMVVYAAIWIASLSLAFYGLSKVTDPSELISHFAW